LVTPNSIYDLPLLSIESGMFNSAVQSNKNSARLKRSKQLAAVIVAFGIVIMLAAVYMYYIGLSARGSAQSNDYSTAILLAVVSFIALSMSSFVLQLRKLTVEADVDTPKMMTTIECRGCGAKTVREFQRGDFVFKELEPCQKCGGTQVITAIYREIKEKEKTYDV